MSLPAASGRGSRSGMWLMACSAIAVIVRLGLTPMLAGIAAFERKDFNSYGARRGNHEVMVRAPGGAARKR